MSEPLILANLSALFVSWAWTRSDPLEDALDLGSGSDKNGDLTDSSAGASTIYAGPVVSSLPSSKTSSGHSSDLELLSEVEPLPCDPTLDGRVVATQKGGPLRTKKARQQNLVDRLVEGFGIVTPTFAMMDNPKTFPRAVLLLLQCGIDVDDICSVLAHTSFYFADLCTQTSNMVPGEADRLATLLLFIAHSYVLDEHCPLKVWHKYLFDDYCSIEALNKAILCMMKLRGYIMRVDDGLLRIRHKQLLAHMS